MRDNDSTASEESIKSGRSRLRRTYRRTALLLVLVAAQTLPSGPAGSAGTWTAWEEKKVASPTPPQALSAAGTEDGLIQQL